jgi:hypothetical protein
MPVQRVLISPPRCRMGAITPEERAAVRTRSPVSGKYDAPVNRESAHEILSRRAGAAEAPVRSSPAEENRRPAPEVGAGAGGARAGGKLRDMLWGTRRRQGMVETMAKQAARTVGSQFGRQLLRGVLGGLLGGSRRR